MSDVRQQPVPHPRELLRQRLEELGWTAPKLKSITGRDPNVYYEIMKGKKAITAQTALHLAAALGGTAEEWLARQMEYDLAEARRAEGDKVRCIEKRAVLQKLMPNMEDAEQQGWLPPGQALDQRWEAVHKLLGIEPGQQPDLTIFSGCGVPTDKSALLMLNCWWHVVRQKASEQNVEPRSPLELDQVLRSQLIVCGEEPNGLRFVRRYLSLAGVRLVILPAPEGLLFDGAAQAGEQPIIALTLSHDTYGDVWCTLLQLLSLTLVDRTSSVWVWSEDRAKEAHTFAERHASQMVGDLYGTSHLPEAPQMNPEMGSHRIAREAGSLSRQRKTATPVGHYLKPQGA